MLGIVVVAVVLGGLVVAWRRSQSSPPPKPDPWTRAASAKTVPVSPAREKLNWLVGTGGEVSGKAFFIGQRTVTIGRGPQNFIQVNNAGVSRTHCQISGGPGALRIVDMESTLGVKIRG